MLLLLALGSVGAPALAQDNLAVTSAPSPVGAGARATAVGSAFIALADDATAASWNPAGLVQLERPELSAVGAGFLQVDRIGTLRDQRDDGSAITADFGTDETWAARLNFLSAALPFSWRGRNVVVSLNYQQMLAFDRDLRGTVLAANENGGLVEVEIDLEQRGAVFAFSPAVAVEITPELSLGGALNYWFDGLGRSHAWSIDLGQDLTITSPSGEISMAPGSSREVIENVRGVNGTFGLLWEMLPGLKLGAVVELPFDIDLRARERTVIEAGTFDFPQDATIEYPLSYGFGLSWRVRDEAVLSVDVTRVEWDDYRVETEFGASILASGDPAGSASVSGVTTVRAGFEYLLVQRAGIAALRLGAFYDPEPSRGAPEDFYGVAAGLGWTMSDLSIDLAYSFRFGLDVSGLSVSRRILETPRDGFDLFQHNLYLSAIYYF